MCRKIAEIIDFSLAFKENSTISSTNCTVHSFRIFLNNFISFKKKNLKWAASNNITPNSYSIYYGMVVHKYVEKSKKFCGTFRDEHMWKMHILRLSTDVLKGSAWWNYISLCISLWMKYSTRFDIEIFIRLSEKYTYIYVS